MKINRRNFAITAGTMGVLASLPACWFSNVYKTISDYVPVALLAFDRINMVLMEHGVNLSMEVIDRVKAALADVQTAVLEYRDAHEHDKQTLIHSIAVALKIASERLMEFWEHLKIPNEQLARTIKMLLDVMISTLTGFIGRLAPGSLVAGQRFLSQPKPRTLKEFREDFNQVLRDNNESKFMI